MAALGALAVAGTASAIVGGVVDQTHTYVGAYLQQQVQGGQAGTELCTGFLIGPEAFVTAAHCYDPAGGPVLVSFDTGLGPAASFTTATFAAAQDDVAVFTLADAQPGPWASLPAVNASASAGSVDVVGYGVLGLTPQKTPTGVGVRELATTALKSAGNLRDLSLKLLSSPGACFGDSGGPNLLHGTTTVVAITSGGSKNCNGVSYAERIDTPAMLAFLSQFASG
jgi:secreted trypsin-like serine protease